MQSMRANIGKGIAAGVIGGLIASWVMERAQQVIQGIRQKAEEAAPALGRALEWPTEGQIQSSGEQEPATTKVAVLVSSKVFCHELQPNEKETAGEAVHYAFGALVGGIYGALAEYAPEARAGAGSGFGTLLWALSDELGVPLAGLSGPPQKYPVGTHASALAAHIVYGVSTELVRSALRNGALAR
jgi:putative membrane protein